MRSADVVAAHRAAGREFTAAGVQSFVREQGDGEPVVLMHGVPASSFLYRKVLPELAQRGLRGVAFDLPGLGLAERPERFDYTWSGLGAFAVAAVDALGLGDFHLVVHDIGGPVGFELAAGLPERIKSLTLLNTLVEVAGFRRPWMMEPFGRRGIGELWLRTMTPATFRGLMLYAGIADHAATPPAETAAYIDLLKREDGGRAFLRIMRGFERTAAKQALYTDVVRRAAPRVQVVWGARDPALRLAVHGERARLVAGVSTVHAVAGKHFLQEDHAPAIAERIAALAGA